MELQRLLYGFVRKIWLAVLLAIIGGGIAGYASMFMTTPVYVAESTLYALNRDRARLTGESVSYEDVALSRQLVQDYTEIIHSDKVISAVQRELSSKGLDESTLNSMVSVDLRKDSNVLIVRTAWVDPETAALVANSVSRALISKVRELTNSDNLSILDEAKVPGSPNPVNHNKNILIGLLAGMVLAFGVIYVIELFDTTIRSAEDIENGLKMPVVGIIPEHDIR